MGLRGLYAVPFSSLRFRSRNPVLVLRAPQTRQLNSNGVIGVRTGDLQPYSRMQVRNSNRSFTQIRTAYTIRGRKRWARMTSHRFRKLGTYSPVKAVCRQGRIVCEER